MFYRGESRGGVKGGKGDGGIAVGSAQTFITFSDGGISIVDILGTVLTALVIVSINLMYFSGYFKFGG